MWFFYYQVNMKDRKCFSDQMNRNRFHPILAWHDWSCSTMENLRCLNFPFLLIMSHPRFRVNVHCSCLNIKGLLDRNRRDIWTLSNCSRSQFHNHLFHKRMLNHLAPLETQNSFTVFMQTLKVRLELSEKLWFYSNKKIWY